MFTFNYDLQCITDLRKAMNENTFFAINKIDKHKENFYYQSWGRMCAAMDRIEDTMSYINSMSIGEDDDTIAFDFYDFINNVYVVIENIKTMANIFEADFCAVEKLSTSFNLKYSDGEWFSYIRSLCSVHPTETTGKHHRGIMLNEKMGCCASVAWDMVHRLSNGDLVAIIYNFPEDKSGGKNVPDYTHNYVPLYVKHFQNYLQRWLDFIPTIITAIHNYNDTRHDELKQLPIKKLSDCKNDIEKIAVLKHEYNRRYGDEIDEIFDFYLTVFVYHLSNEYNRTLIEKYKNAIRLGCEFLYNALQNMSFDGYDNTGLKYNKNSFLFYELYYASPYDILSLHSYGYHLSKLYLLNSRSYFDNERARHLLDELKPIANRYVIFTNSEVEDETLILMQMVIYFAALESKCTLNKNIPNDLQYRTKLLSQEEIEALLEEEEIEESSYDLKDMLPDDLKDLFE